MDSPEPFLAAILARPDDDAPRLIFCDWLIDAGAPDDLIEFVRGGKPWPDKVAKALWGSRCFMLWERPRRRQPFVFRPGPVVGTPQGGSAAAQQATRTIMLHLAPARLIQLPEVKSAVRRCWLEEIAERVRGWWE